MASGISVMLRPGFAFRGGRVTGERQGARVAAYQWGARSGAGMSISGSEQFSLPRLHRELRDVGVYLGVPGAQTWQVQAASAAIAPAQTFEPLGRMVERAWSMVGRGSTGGPSESARRRARAGVLARALDESGHCLAEVRLEGAIPTSSPRRSWRGVRHEPPKVSSGPAERWDPLRRSTSTCSAAALQTPACGPSDQGSGRIGHPPAKTRSSTPTVPYSATSRTPARCNGCRTSAFRTTRQRASTRPGHRSQRSH